jgi:hypothetical protein
MAGNTAVIDRATLKAQWESYIPLQVIAAHWTVSVHQLIRLRVVWEFPPRNDRKRRYKPSRAERLLDLSPAELAASEDSLALAPLVAERVTVVQAWWTPEDRAEREMTSKAEPLRLAPLDLPQEFVDAEEEGDAFW